MPRRRAVPDKATVVLRMKPGALLSRRYHRVGFERARVRESCRVECHGIRRCDLCQFLSDSRRINPNDNECV